MKTGGTTLLLLGLVVGMAVGWGGAELLREGGPPPPVEEAAAPAPEPDDLAGPRLVPRARPHDEPSEPADASAGPVAQLTPEAVEQLRVFETVNLENLEAVTKGVPALAMIYALSGRVEDFLRVADIALSSGMDLTSLYSALQALPMEHRVEVLDTLLARYPDVSFPVQEVAGLYMAAGAPDRALAIVRNALAETPGFPEPLLTLLVSLDPPTALTHARARVDENPSDPNAWAFLARLHMMAEDRTAAFDALAEAARLSPTSGYLNHLRSMDVERAIPIIEALTEGSRDDEALGALAKAYEDAGRYDEALEVFLRANEIDPLDGEWLSHMATLDPEGTVARLEAQIGSSLETVSDELVGDYADALRSLGRLDEAFEHYLIAFEKDPADWEWQNALVSMDPERALPLLEERARAAPGESVYVGALARALAATGRRQEAIDAFVQAIDRGDTQLYHELAQLDPDMALTRLRAVVAQQPSNDELWGDLGDLYRMLGREEQAVEAYTRARQLDPNDGEWINALAR
jgi:tetratricopeptide (TPR) repeat protein